MTAAPPPNWYPDPHDKAQLRWWDGQQWTEHRHPAVPTEASTEQPRTEQPRTETPVDTTPATLATAATAVPVAATTPAVVDQWATASVVPTPDKLGGEKLDGEKLVGEKPADAQLADALPAAATPTADTTINAAAAREQWAQRTASWQTPPMSTPPMSTPPTTAVPALTAYPEGAPKPKSRTPMIIGAIVIAALVVGVIAFVATRGGDDDKIGQSPGTTVATTRSSATSTTTPPATTSATTTTTPVATTVTPTVTTLAGTIFTDPTNVYRLRKAPTWQDATAVGGLQTWTTGTSSSQFKDQVNVLIEKLPSDISMDDYLAASVKNAPKSLPSFVEVSRSVNTVNGKVLGQLDFRSTQNGVALRHRAVVLIKARNAIVVTYTAEPGRFDTESPNVQPYLTSVEGV